jgi:outer membrane protein
MQARSVTLHFTQFGRLHPYIGAGPLFLHIFKNSDAAVQNLHVQNSAGAVLAAGADWQLDSRWSAFFDVKKTRLQTKATGLLGGVPIQADIQLNPTVVTAGVTFRF